MAKCQICGVKIAYSEGQNLWFHNSNGHIHLHCRPDVATPRKKDLRKLLKKVAKGK